MKLTDLRVCDNCGEAETKIPFFYVVRFSLAAFNKKNVDQVAGINRYFGGNHLPLEGKPVKEIQSVQLAERSRWLPEPRVGRVADGVSNRVDRLKGLGNAVVPQVVEWIGSRILEANNLLK